MKGHLTKLHKPVHVLNRSEKWSEYYTCKECEDEVNRKGHLTKHQEAVHLENISNDI